MKSTLAAARLIQLVKTRATVVRLEEQTGLPGACALAAEARPLPEPPAPPACRHPATANGRSYCCLACPHALSCTAGEVVIDQREVVPGDCVRLYAGELVPGDVRIVAAKDLFLGWVRSAATAAASASAATASSDSGIRIYRLVHACFGG